MGIPALFRWLSNKYPKIMSNVKEDLPEQVGEETIPVDSSQPNPNGLEIDNLYLDMNGIIHPCCHPEDKPAPNSEDEMYIEIFKYIDRIFCMIRPRKLLYMAIDGVAPRAKMNQQRSRRFRASQEEEIKRKDEERIRMDLGLDLEDAPKKNHFDSNCITPGTPFMDQLAICLRYYVIDRLNNDPGWRNVQVILSDASVPGEGEHKIMDFIRRQKSLSTYDPNTKHVLYGLDADLIMLALATHEPYFWILREEVSVKNFKDRACETCGQTGHNSFQCRGAAKERVGKWDDQTKYLELKPFLFVHISVLREYLEEEMKLLDAPFEWDVERAIDDWVFMCFFVGNDFLPHLPSLDIREGAVEVLIGIWKKLARNWTGYLTDSGDIALDRVQTVMEELGLLEDQVFIARRENDESRRIKRLERKQRNRQGNNYDGRDQNGNLPKTLLKSAAYIQEQMSGLETFSVKDKSIPQRKRPAEMAKFAQEKKPHFSHHNPDLGAANMDAAKKLKMELLGKLGKKEMEKNPTGQFSMSDFQAPSEPAVVNVTKTVEVEAEEVVEEEEEELEAGDVPVVDPELIEELEEALEPEPETGIVHKVDIDSDEEAPEDDVKLWEAGWKARYYENKFQVTLGDDAFRQSVVKSYVEGLCWVLKYYYQGVQSWKWYYPFHYAPFASDFKDIGDLDISFEKSRPFSPIEQLMGVFPAASRQHIPQPFHFLMTDPDSPIIDFYPVEFPIDLNGKKYAWQGVALLPFIDADRLVEAMKPFHAKLTAEEVHRNTMGNDILFTPGGHKNFDNMCNLYKSPPIKKPVALDPYKAGLISGLVFKDPNVTLPGSTHISPLREFNLEDCVNMSSISAQYFLPPIAENYKFRARLLRSAVLPPFILNDADRHTIRQGDNNPFSSTRGRGGYRGRGGRGAINRFVRHGLSLRASATEQRDYGNGNFDKFGRTVRIESARNNERERERERSPSRYDNSRSRDRSPSRYNDRSRDRSPRYNDGRGSRSNSNSNSPRRYNRDHSPRGYDRDYNRNQSRGQERRSYNDTGYMGGGGYANFDSNGKYRGSGYQPPATTSNSSSMGYQYGSSQQFSQTSQHYPAAPAFVPPPNFVAPQVPGFQPPAGSGSTQAVLDLLKLLPSKPK